jgi:hypothetical protein
MSEPPEGPPVPAEGAPAPDPASAEKKRKKKKDKVRSAWISFVGRIVAQVVGAAASIGLALYFLNQHQKGVTENRDTGSVPQRSPSRVSAHRYPGVVALAVLPLANFSGEPGQDYFADGMTEALIADLSQIDGLRVVSRTSSMAYKGQQKPMLRNASFGAPWS